MTVDECVTHCVNESVSKPLLVATDARAPGCPVAIFFTPLYWVLARLIRMLADTSRLGDVNPARQRPPVYATSDSIVT